jgi:hypothetical protein
MQDTVRCPSCKAILVVPPLPPEGDFACPRCRALVPLTATEPALQLGRARYCRDRHAYPSRRRGIRAPERAG